MDKETLSNYGWIVICVMVMAVMLAFASPFGNFIAGAIKSTTQGLFDTNQNALDSAGIEIMQQEFEEMLNGPSATNTPVKFGQPYQMTADGMTMEYVFYADGSATMWMADAMAEYMPAGSFVYTATEVIMGEDPISITPDGTTLYDPNDETLKMTVKSVSKGSPKTNTPYIADPYGYMGIVGVDIQIGTDGSITIYQNGVAGETIPASAIQWYENYYTVDGEVAGAIYPSGSKISIDGMVCTTDACKHNFDSNYICSLCGYENNYRVSAASYMSLTGIDISSGDVVIPETFKGTDGKWYHVVGVAYQGFQSCTNLTSITLPDSIKTIESYAFRHCRNLTSIFVPENVKTIGTEVFYGCTNLESITVDENNLTFHSFENCIINTANKELIAGCKNSIIPTDGSVTSIRAFAFAYTSLTSIEIPNTVTVIKNKAFADCLWLTSVTIPDTVTAIDLMAFYYCTQLDTIKYTGTIEQWNKITFGADWYLDTAVTEIICSDGTVSLS